MADLVNASAQAIADALAPSPQAPAARWRWGSVVSVNADGTMNVSIGGATVPGVRCAQHVMGAQVGDRVRVLYCGTEAMVDAVRASSLLLNLPTVDLHSTNLTSNVTPSAMSYGNGRLYFRDSGNALLGVSQPVFTTGGRQGMRYGAYRTIGETNYSNMVYLYVNSDGSKSVVFSSNGGKEAWLDALGLTVENRTLTANTSNVTMQGENYARSFGNVVQLNLVFTTKRDIPTWDNQNFIVGTMDRACAYSKQYMTAIAQIDGQWTLMQAGVNGSGEVRLRTVGTAIPSGTWTWVFGTYISV